MGSRAVLSLLVLVAFASQSAALGKEVVFGPEDYQEVAGILSWLIEVPDDLAASQFLSTSWLFPSIGGKRSEIRSSGLDFRDVPAGEMVKVFVWIRDLVDAGEEEAQGMKFCLKFRGKNRKMQTRFGTLELPPGFIDVYSHLPASNQPYYDGGWLLMMSNPGANKGAASCTLELDYEDR